MERKILLTNDGSVTLETATGDTYHSKAGAIQEGLHVYINAGLHHFIQVQPGISHLKVFETGLGTGLNALLTAQYAQQHGLHIDYHAVEPYPLDTGEVAALNYGAMLQDEQLLRRVHDSAWWQAVCITENFTLTKHQQGLADYNAEELYHVVYHDAFAPDTQPELWTEEVFNKLCNMLEKGGILTTYCSKVTVQKAMRHSGLLVSKQPGPWGKRDILRAEKP